MASPLKTWTSVFLVLVACWYLAFNSIQFWTASEADRHPNVTPKMAAQTAGTQEIMPGLVGVGVLMAFLGIAALVVFTHWHERPNFRKSQTMCYAMVWLGLILTAVLHLIMWILARNRIDSKLMLKLELGVSALRLVIAGGIIGCGVHVLHA